jgi:hypothetical protein
MADLFSYGPRNIREFIKTNLVAVLYTIIFHLVVLIILVIAKTEGLKNDRELGVLLDFSEELTLEEMLEEEQIDVPPEWIEQVYRAREQASNRAVNLEDRVKEEISTEDYVNDLLNELEAQKDEDYLKNREKWKEIISSYVYEEEVADPKAGTDKEKEPFTGPTTITYEFLDPPKNRQQRMLTIPVYRCEGSAEVEVLVTVRRNGTVDGVEITSVQSGETPSCFIEAAENAARTSVFFSDYKAPEKQRARITYQFVAQN